MGPAPGLVSSERHLLRSWGGSEAVRKGSWGSPSFAAWLPGHSLPRGRGSVNSPAGLQPANEFSGSEAGPGVSPHLKTNTPSQNLGQCCYPPPGVPFLPLPLRLFISLGPWSLGPRGTAPLTDVTLVPPLLLPGAENCCQEPGVGQCTSVLSETSGPSSLAP